MDKLDDILENWDKIPEDVLNKAKLISVYQLLYTIELADPFDDGLRTGAGLCIYRIATRLGVDPSDLTNL